MDNQWYTNPKLLLIGGVGLFAAILLLRNQGTAKATDTNAAPTQYTPGNNPSGGSYSYLDGSGVQHMVATDPQGNLLGYNTLPPDTSMPQTGQLSSYVGGMSGLTLASPYGSTTPYYSMPWYSQSGMSFSNN